MLLKLLEMNKRKGHRGEIEFVSFVASGLMKFISSILGNEAQIAHFEIYIRKFCDPGHFTWSMCVPHPLDQLLAGHASRSAGHADSGQVMIGQVICVW